MTASECGRGWGGVRICQSTVKNVTCTARQGERREQINEGERESEVVGERRCSALFGTLFVKQQQGKIPYSLVFSFLNRENAGECAAKRRPTDGHLFLKATPRVLRDRARARGRACVRLLFR